MRFLPVYSFFSITVEFCIYYNLFSYLYDPHFWSDTTCFYYLTPYLFISFTFHSFLIGVFIDIPQCVIRYSASYFQFNIIFSPQANSTL